MNTNTRLRIATRIHFGLLRHLGEGIDIGRMLKSPAEAREVLWVCDASGDAELVALARQFRLAQTLVEHMAEGAAAGGHAAQDTPWAKDSSGFGVTQPPALPGTAPAPKRAAGASTGWLAPISWLRRGHHTSR